MLIRSQKNKLRSRAGVVYQKLYDKLVGLDRQNMKACNIAPEDEEEASMFIFREVTKCFIDSNNDL